MPPAQEVIKSDNAANRPEKEKEGKKTKRLTKEEREKNTAKSGNSVMEEQNRMRKEAQKAKKEEKLRLAREKANAGGGAAPDKLSKALTMQKKTTLGAGTAPLANAR